MRAGQSMHRGSTDRPAWGTAPALGTESADGTCSAEADWLHTVRESDTSGSSAPQGEARLASVV